MSVVYATRMQIKLDKPQLTNHSCRNSIAAVVLEPPLAPMPSVPTPTNMDRRSLRRHATAARSIHVHRAQAAESEVGLWTGRGTIASCADGPGRSAKPK